MEKDIILKIPKCDHSFYRHAHGNLCGSTAPYQGCMNQAGSTLISYSLCDQSDFIICCKYNVSYFCDISPKVNTILKKSII